MKDHGVKIMTQNGSGVMNLLGGSILSFFLVTLCSADFTVIDDKVTLESPRSMIQAIDSNFEITSKAVETRVAFPTEDSTPSVSSGYAFELSDLTSITGFDDPVDGKKISVYCGYAAEFSISGGITAANRTTSYVATPGEVLYFWYDEDLTTWIATNMPDETTSSVTSAELATILTDEKGTTGGFSRVSNSPVSYSANSDLSAPTAWYSTIMLTGDDDSSNETLQLQDGSFQGQIVTISAISGIDANDNAVIDVSTDTTCVNHPTDITLDSVGDSVSLVWGGSAWVYTWDNL